MLFFSIEILAWAVLLLWFGHSLFFCVVLLCCIVKRFDFFFPFNAQTFKRLYIWEKKNVSLQCCTFSNEGPSRISSRIASTSASRNFKCLPKKQKKTKNIIKPNSLVWKYTKKVGCLYYFFSKENQKKQASFDIIIQSYLICQNIKIQLQSEPTGAFCEGFDFRWALFTFNMVREELLGHK